MIQTAHNIIKASLFTKEMLDELLEDKSVAVTYSKRMMTGNNASRSLIPFNILVSVLFLYICLGTFQFVSAGTVTYSYDTCANGLGRLCGVSDTSGNTAFSYDAMGQVEQTDKTVDSTTYTAATTYDDAGRVKTISYPESSGTVTYAYDGAVLASVTEGNTTYVEYSNFNQFGQNKTTQYGNGSVETTYTYVFETGTCPRANVPWLCTLVTQKGGNTLQNLTYSYDDSGNITSINDTISGDQIFNYDDLDRLTQAQGPYVTQNYTYDTIGNMLSNTRVGSYNYTGSQPHAVTSAGGNTYSYDANGNMIGGAGRTITYDGENRPIQVQANNQITTILYDGDGGRVKKTIDGTTTTLYIGKLYECTEGVCKRHIYAGNQRIAEVPVADPTDISYYHPDHLGSSSVITYNNQPNDIQRLTYYPYGETFTNSHPTNKEVDYKYTGQLLDDSTGLYFYGARYYDPQLARFISPDTFIQAPGNPQNLNRYSYVLNNPIVYTDPSGNFFQLIVGIAVAAAVGAVISTAINVASAAVNGGDLGQAAIAGAIAGAIIAPTVAIGAPYAATAAGPLAALAVASAGGAAAGAASSAAVGGDIGRGALAGAASIAAGLIAGPAAAGAAGAGVMGEDPFKGAMMGGLTAVGASKAAQIILALATQPAIAANSDYKAIKKGNTFTVAKDKIIFRRMSSHERVNPVTDLYGMKGSPTGDNLWAIFEVEGIDDGTTIEFYIEAEMQNGELWSFYVEGPPKWNVGEGFVGSGYVMAEFPWPKGSPQAFLQEFSRMPDAWRATPVDPGTRSVIGNSYRIPRCGKENCLW